MRFTRGAALILLSLVLAAGCAGRSPAVRYYNFEPMHPPATGMDPAGMQLHIGPVLLPEALQQPRIILRQAPGRLVQAEFDRWASPLESEIPRILGLNLSHLLKASFVAYPRPVGAEALRLQFDIDRFDGMPGGEAELWVRWRVLDARGKGLESGESVLTEAVAGTEVGDLVAAQQRLLGAFSRQLAERLAPLGGRP